MHSLDELSPCEGPEGRGLLARCDARVKLVVAMAAILAVVASTRVWLPLGALALCLAVLAASRMPAHEMVHRLAGALIIAGLICLLQGFMTGTTPVAELDLGPWHLTATREGLLGGALIGSRVMGSVGVLLVLCRATPAHGIFAALRWARAPKTWIEIGMLMYRYTFTLFEQATSVLAAQRIRLGHAGFRRSIRSMGSLAGIVTLRSIDQAERTHEAMVARGYQGSLPIPRLPALSGRDRAAMLSGIALIATVLVLIERCLP